MCSWRTVTTRRDVSSVDDELFLLLYTVSLINHYQLGLLLRHLQLPGFNWCDFVSRAYRYSEWLGCNKFFLFSNSHKNNINSAKHPRSYIFSKKCPKIRDVGYKWVDFDNFCFAPKINDITGYKLTVSKVLNQLHIPIAIAYLEKIVTFFLIWLSQRLKYFIFFRFSDLPL